MPITVDPPGPRQASDSSTVVAQQVARRDPELLPKRSWRAFVFMSHSRLSDLLPAYRSRLERLIASTCASALVADPVPPECNWAVHARRLVDCAEEALRTGRTDLGWKCLHEAERMELHGLNMLAASGETEPLRVRGRSIALEARKKLRGWRKATVRDLLRQGKDPQWVPDVCRLTESHHILTESFANTYHIMRAQRWQVAILAGAAIAALLTWWLGVGTGVLSGPITAASTEGGVTALGSADGLLPSILLFGVLGATVSSIISLVRTEPETIPKQLMAWTGSMARIVIGAIAALVVFLALESTVLAGADSRLILLQAFVAGFSERLLSAAVKNAGG